MTSYELPCNKCICFALCKIQYENKQAQIVRGGYPVSLSDCRRELASNCKILANFLDRNKLEYTTLNKRRHRFHTYFREYIGESNGHTL